MTLKEMFWQDSIHKEWKFAYDDKIIGNELLHQEEITLTQGICEESELRFGSFMASEIKFRVSNVLEPLLSKVLTVSVELEHDFTKTARIGKFKVTSDVPTADRSWRDVTAYDALNEIANADVAEWYKSVLPNEESTITMRMFRESFFANFGVSQETATLANDNLVIGRSIKTDELSGAMVLTAILEANGVFGHINENGNFEYVTLPTITTANAEVIDNTKYVSGSYEDFESKSITKLTIKMEDDDIGFSVGEGNNEYTIKDNFLLYGASVEAATNILSVISNAYYRPFAANVVGNPLVKVGSPLRILTRNATIDSYLLSRTMKGLQALKDSYEAKGTEKHSVSINSVNNQLLKTRGKAVKVQADLDGFKVEVNNYQTQTNTRFDVTDGLINGEIERAKNEEESISNRITVTESEFNVQIENIYKELDGSVNLYEVTEVPTLYNYPAYNFTNNIICGISSLTEGLHFEYTDDSYRKNLRAVANDTTTGQSYRFRTKDGQWYWEVIADAEYTLLVQQITELRTDTDSISTEVSTTKTRLGNLEDIVEYQGTRITETSDAIRLEADRAKGEESKLNASITVTADSVRADARSYATTAKDEAIDSMGYKLLNYSTTEQMNTAIETSASGIKTVIEKEVDETYQRQSAMVNFYTKTQTQQYVTETSEEYDRTIKKYITNGYQTLDGMKDYSSTTEMQSAINQSAESLELSIKSWTNGQLNGYSTISQTQSAISLAVSGKVDTDDVVNVFNLSTEGIDINGNRLTIDSTNFKLSEDGTLWCKNAIFDGILNSNVLMMSSGGVTAGTIALSPHTDGTGSVVLGYGTNVDKVMTVKNVEIIGNLRVTGGVEILGNEPTIQESPILTQRNFSYYVTLPIPKATNEISGAWSSGSYGNYLYFNNSAGGGDNYYCPSTAWVKAYIKANCVMK